MSSPTWTASATVSHRRDAGRSRRSRRSSHCRSTTCCFGRSACIARTSMPNAVQLSHAAFDQDRRLSRGLRLLPAGCALSTPASTAKPDAGRRRRYRRRRRPRRRAPPVSAWARRGAARSRKHLERVSRWCARFARSVSRPARRSACSRPQQAQRAQGGGARLLQPQSRHLGRSSTARSSRRAPTMTGSIPCRPVRDAGLNVCCGGILGMGESRRDRVSLLHSSRRLPQHPESVPINQLVQVRRHAAARHAGARPARIRAGDRDGPRC